MTIGISAMAAVKQPRTGVEEYTYQLIKHLTMLPEAGEHRFFLYISEGETNPSMRPSTNSGLAQGILPEPFDFAQDKLESKANPFDFPLPSNFEIKILRWPLPFLWTQVRLAWEMLVRPPEVLFIPVHILPFGAPKNSVVSIHGLEYEYFPEYYPWPQKLYLRWSTKRSAKRAKKIIAISENTKNDLVKLYGVAPTKISVVHHGVGDNSNFVIPAKAGIQAQNPEPGFRVKPGMTIGGSPYLLYLGRLETKKNVQGILAAYKILKEKYKIPHQLVLVGAPGYGYETLRLALRSRSGNDIVELGYVSEKRKRELLAGADIFLFPSFYEGFGLPVLEAQAAGAAVIASFNSCLPEIAGEGALFVNPANPSQIAEAVKQIIDDKPLRDKLRQSGLKNIKRFSWEKCARETLKVIVSG